jgi:hypothetical protein
VNLYSDPEAMAWLDDLTAELQEAEAEKQRLKQLLLEGYQRIEESKHELRRLTSLINEYTNLRHRKYLWECEILDSQYNSECKLQSIERTIELYVLLPKSVSPS